MEYFGMVGKKDSIAESSVVQAPRIFVPGVSGNYGNVGGVPVGQY